MQLTVQEIAERVEGVVCGDGACVVSGVAPAATASAGDLTFAENEAFLSAAEQGQAAAILVPEAL